MKKITGRFLSASVAVLCGLTVHPVFADEPAQVRAEQKLDPAPATPLDQAEQMMKEDAEQVKTTKKLLSQIESIVTAQPN